MLDSGICADAKCSTFASVGVGPANDAYMSLHDHTDFGFRAIMTGSRSGCNASGDDEDGSDSVPSPVNDSSDE
jgi:hypothetical protein